MMNNIKTCLFQLSLCLLLLSCNTENDLPITIKIEQNWQFKSQDDTIWYGAKVPGNTLSDLLDNAIVKNPFVLNNESDAQWVSERDWEYKTTFTLDDEILSKEHVTLNFNGLDTYASIFLNDSLLLQTKNAFREFKLDVKELIKENNELRIVLERTSKFEHEASSRLGYSLPEGERIFTRKAQFQYGWDWGPKLNTPGIWRPVELIAWNDYRIDGIFVDTLELNDSIVDLRVDIESDSNVHSELYYDLFVNHELKAEQKKLENSQFQFQIEQPRLWWPNNIGDPYFYDIKVFVKDKKR